MAICSVLVDAIRELGPKGRDCAKPTIETTKAET